jgi:hypothetical protein
MAYVLNTIAGVGMIAVINHHMSLAWWECLIMGFSFAWYFGKV